MSTRANIIIKDGTDKLIFYRHSDGYPEGVAATLNAFLDDIKAGKIRNNLSQSAGWLILLGHNEYEAAQSENRWLGYEWKVGAYEPTTCIHGDIEYLYEIDLVRKTLKGWAHDGSKKLGVVTVPQAKAA